MKKFNLLFIFATLIFAASTMAQSEIKLELVSGEVVKPAQIKEINFTHLRDNGIDFVELKDNSIIDSFDIERIVKDQSVLKRRGDGSGGWKNIS